MSEFSGTPGPWHVFFHGPDNCWVVDADKDSAVAKVMRYQSDGAAQKANFNLISAAPELFEALQAALEWIDAVPQGVQLPTMPGFERDWVDGIINKALGR